jgi:hypothetical protein
MTEEIRKSIVIINIISRAHHHIMLRTKIYGALPPLLLYTVILRPGVTCPCLSPINLFILGVINPSLT